MKIRATITLFYSWAEYNRKRVNFILNRMHNGSIRCLDNISTYTWSYSLQF